MGLLHFVRALSVVGEESKEGNSKEELKQHDGAQRSSLTCFSAEVLDAAGSGIL